MPNLTPPREDELPSAMLDLALDQLSLILHGFGCRFPGGRVVIEERPSIVIANQVPPPGR